MTHSERDTANFCSKCNDVEIFTKYVDRNEVRVI